MDSTRQQKFARTIQKDLGDIFIHEGKSIYGNSFVTVTGVRVTPDLGIARVYISILQKNNREGTLESIRKAKGEIRRMIGIRMRNTIHHIPDLEFFLDESLDYVENIDRVMKDIVVPKETKTNKKDYNEEI